MSLNVIQMSLGIEHLRRQRQQALTPTQGGHLPRASVALTCKMSQLWAFSLLEPNTVKTVLFSPGSVSNPYTNTGCSENTDVFQVSPSLVLYL